MIRNAAQIYGQNKVKTASPAELTLMLYEGCIKFCNIAIEGVEQKDIVKAHTNIVKIENIIVELQSTLDRKYDVAKDFDVIYDYIYNRLVEANLHKDKELLQDVLIQLRDLADSWKQIMKIASGSRK